MYYAEVLISSIEWRESHDMCPFEISFDEELTEKEYAKLKPKMEKKLKKVRERKRGE